jgi:N-methylhydantoinase A
MTDPDRYLIGVDIGGTFTDAVVVAPDGGITVGKVSTTPEDFSQGFFASITAAAAALGLEETRLWRRTERLAHGRPGGTATRSERWGAGDASWARRWRSSSTTD